MESLQKKLRYCFLLLLFLSCSTEKNTFLRRGFHNLHAKYNGFFNANEIIKETFQNFENNRKENYNQILPIYPLPSFEESKNWYSPMDTAASKCELVIFRHRMPHEKKGRNRNKEWCKWIDDNWMTIGKTKYYKKDFSQALKIFQYVENHFPIENSFYESSYWQAKVLIEMESYEQAEEILLSLIAKNDELLYKQPKRKEEFDLKEKIALLFNYDERIENKKKQPQIINKKTVNKIYATLADLYLRNGRKRDAIQYLEDAINLKFKRNFKTRLIYILAQIYHQEGNFKASSYYQQVVERNPEYEMAFQAKINRALAFSGSQSKAIKAQLLKMLKDDKNIDYFDQIYYALAEIAFNDNNNSEAIKNLQTSIDLSKGNVGQKIKSMKRMGDWHFDEENYTTAYHYYDTVMKIIPTKYESLKSIEKKYNILTKLFNNEQTIIYNDSVLKICDMSEEDRLKKIFEVIDKIEKDKEDKIRNEDSKTENNLIAMSNNNFPGQSIFFWDQSSLERGKKEFNAIWGKRKLEDNWRRSNKNFIISEDFVPSVDREDNAEKYQVYLKNLPCDSPEKKQLMKDSILMSLFNTGITHHYETENLTKAEEYFKIALENYQPKTYAIASAYELYRIYEYLKMISQKDQMKQILLSKYPNSKYAKLISSNSNLTETEQELILEQNNYQNLFYQYELGNYSNVIYECSKKIEDSTNVLFCKYGLLMAYSQGKLANQQDSPKTKLIQTLKKVVDRCQGNEIGEQASDILKRLKVAHAESFNKEKEWNFEYNPDTVHFFILFSPKGVVNVNNAKNNIADFNASSFSDKNLKTSSTFLNTSDQMIIVKKFSNSSMALDYYYAFKVNNGPIKKYRDNDYFILSPHNLKELYLEKTIKNYNSFFKEFYL